MLIDKDHPMMQNLFERFDKVEQRIEELIVSKVAWEWMTNREVVTALNMSPEYIAKLRKSGQLTCSRIGNKHFFKRKDVQALLESKRLDAFASR